MSEYIDGIDGVSYVVLERNIVGYIVKDVGACVIAPIKEEIVEVTGIVVA